MRTNKKATGHIILWAIIILSLAIAEYYLINKYVDEDAYGKIVEDRTLTTNEQEFFSEYLLNNKGFSQNFYDTTKDLNLSYIVGTGQGNDLTKELTTDEKKNIVMSDFKNVTNYDYLVANPADAFNIILDGIKLRSLFNDKTGDKYNNSETSQLWPYNREYDVYYNSIGYGIEESFPNHYNLTNIKITDNSVYTINYTTYYKPTSDSPDYRPNYKEELYSGVITLKKIDETHYHFVSNVVTEMISLINTMKNYHSTYDLNTVIATTTKTMDKTYYGDGTKHKVTITKYIATEDSSHAYAIKVVPFKDDLYEEMYHFDNNGDLAMYVMTDKDNLSTYYSFSNDVLNAKYEELQDDKFEFKAYTKSIEAEGEYILSEVKKIDILN